jgi:hypothetical protein
MDDFTFLVEKANAVESIKIKVIDVPFLSTEGFNDLEKILKEKITRSLSFK